MYQNYTVKEFADIYAVHTNTVRNWINDGTIEVIRPGGRIIRIPASQCDVLAMPIRSKPHPR